MEQADAQLFVVSVPAADKAPSVQELSVGRQAVLLDLGIVPGLQILHPVLIRHQVDGCDLELFHRNGQIGFSSVRQVTHGAALVGGPSSGGVFTYSGREKPARDIPDGKNQQGIWHR